MKFVGRHVFRKCSLEYLHMQCIPCFLCLRILCIKFTKAHLNADRDKICVQKCILEHVHMQCGRCFLYMRILSIKVIWTNLIVDHCETWHCLEFNMQFGARGHAVKMVFFCV